VSLLFTSRNWLIDEINWLIDWLPSRNTPTLCFFTPNFTWISASCQPAKPETWNLPDLKIFRCSSLSNFTGIGASCHRITPWDKNWPILEYKSGSHTESGGNFARGSEPTSSSLFIPNFVLIGVCCVVNERQKLQILAYCQIQNFLVASPSEKIDNRKPSLIQRNQNRS